MERQRDSDYLLKWSPLEGRKGGGGMRERETEREAETETERQRETERGRERVRQRERQIDRDRETKRERMQTDRHMDIMSNLLKWSPVEGRRRTERQTDGQTDRDIKRN